MQNKNLQSIVSAIVVVGVIIAGAILLKGSSAPTPKTADDTSKGIPVSTGPTLMPVGKDDRTQGNPNAKVTFIIYEDFQCPFCGAISGLETGTALMKSMQQRDPSWAPFMPEVMKDVANGSLQFVYRDYAFLGPESIKSAEAARCAGDQGKFWEFHDYLYGHQNGENQGGFSDTNLKSFAKGLGLNTTTFNTCLDTGKYTLTVNASKSEGDNAGVTGTPKGFILKNGKIVATIDGAEGLVQVKAKLDAALK